MTNKKIASQFAVGIIFLLAAFFAAIFFFMSNRVAEENKAPNVENQVTNKPAEKKVCTMEAKLCLDGTYVSRTGPSCEFTPCPNSSE